MVVAELCKLAHPNRSKRAFVRARLDDNWVTFLFDMGANVNIVPSRLVPDKVHPTYGVILLLKSSTLKTPTFLITDFEQPILGSHAATINIKDEVLPHYLGDCPAPVTFEDKVKKELEKIKPAKWVSPIVSVSNTSIPQTSSVVQPIH
ncbi:unnamed protein product [Lepeophtheirus salmonis]|uniref:(salmon louse) hypothetical protein n=1 Tax=Lepeophtheirus salmonis TaxID=72036 RepID=A0A7R8CVY6_LEPSM|nr:unnamed protein product [Lepeophtheirus salmonis]CAF2916929.1 unnamed protein product [Lepeophtheirus salmonis]